MFTDAAVSFCIAAAFYFSSNFAVSAKCSLTGIQGADITQRFFFSFKRRQSDRIRENIIQNKIDDLYGIDAWFVGNYVIVP